MKIPSTRSFSQDLGNNRALLNHLTSLRTMSSSSGANWTSIVPSIVGEARADSLDHSLGVDDDSVDIKYLLVMYT